MDKITIIPYQSVKNKQYNEVEIDISAQNFNGVDHKRGTITFMFDQCDFRKIRIINKEQINFKEISISFNYCFIEDFSISDITSDNISLMFFSSIITGRIDNNIIKDISLNNCITISLNLLNQNSINIAYTEENIFPKEWNKFIKRGDVSSINDLLKIEHNISINNSKNIRISANEKKSEKRGLYRNDFQQIDDWKIGLYLSSTQKDRLKINISIRYSNEIKDELTKISNCLLNSLVLSGDSSGEMLIENSTINSFYIRDFSASKEVLFFAIAAKNMDSKLEIHKSNLDNTWFDNIDFNGYEILSFYRTRFAKAYFTSCNFPDDSLSFEKFKTLENIHYPEKKPQNYYKDQYETFLQLKLSLTNTGNVYEAQKLNAISKEALRKIPSLSKWDKSILWINSYSNNHNLSIKKPFWGLIGFSVLFYILYLLSIGRIFNSNEIDWTLIGQYFSFIDLTHKNDFLISKSEFTFWTLFLDIFNKIVVGFYIYQFIAAFRKYGK